MSRTFAGSTGIVAACLMAGLLGVIAVTGRWPVDAPRTHVEAGGILSLPAERVTRVEFSAGEQRAVFSRNPREEPSSLTAASTANGQRPTPSRCHA